MRPAAKATEATEASTTTKHIAKHGENIIHGESTAGESAKAIHVRAIKTELVILLAFLRIMQHIVGFSCLFEFLFSLFVTRISVRMVFDGYLSVCLFYFVFIGILAHAQNLVIISFCHALLFHIISHHAIKAIPSIIVQLPLWHA